MQETRSFSIHPGYIYDLVVAQSGSLAKAVLECVMNSIDAGATQIAIDVSSKTLRIVDDGVGFKNRKEIEDWFEVFGFPHEAGKRVYGKFGIGRAQLWSFCSTTWRTGSFVMDVDIKARGLDYVLKEKQPLVKGVTIEGRFYEKLLAEDRAVFERELTELARYAQIPVVLNGKTISTHPKEEKWDHETDDAWIRIVDSKPLGIYNLGVLVNQFPAYKFGVGGTVVTKPGKGLALNTARNDILVTQCAVWRRLKPYLQKKSDDRLKEKKTRLSEAMLENLAHRFLAGNVDPKAIADVKIVTDIVGHHHTMRGAALACYHYSDKGRVMVIAEAGSRLGEQAHRAKLAFVLSPTTLTRFGVESVAEFKTAVLKRFKKTGAPDAHYWERVTTSEDLKATVPTLQAGYEVIAEKTLKPAEKAVLEGLRKAARYVGYSLVRQGVITRGADQRKLFVGVSDSAAAWTDGYSKIVIERAQLKLAKDGLGGWIGLVGLLVHEFLHSSSDAGSHLHDAVFYEQFHEVMTLQNASLDNAVLRGFQAYLGAMRRAGVPLDKKQLRQIGVLEGADELPDEPEAAPASDD